MSTSTLPVLVVGAGPTGLTLANTLARYGVQFRIIDKHAAPLELTKAAAIHARALEIFADLDIADAVLDEGQRVDILDLRTDKQDRLHFDFNGLQNTPYPFMIDLPQFRTEYLLIDKLVEQGVAIEREVALVDFTQQAEYVEVRLRHKDAQGNEREELCNVRWLVGCDGSKSLVRQIAGLDFHGAAYADDWVLCDAVIDWPLPRNEMTFSSDAEGIYGIFPLPGDRKYRVAYTQSYDENGTPIEPDMADAQRAMARTGLDGRILETSQFWVFNLAHRQVDRYRNGRVFLVGDAAHVHTPFGGQGMNLGVADAFNLGWKLALAEQGWIDEAILDTYHEERHDAAKGVVRNTHIGASAMLIRDSWPAMMRDRTMDLLNITPHMESRAIRTLSQLNHNYRGKTWIQGKSDRLSAGDRAPDQHFYDGISQRYVHMFELLRGPSFKLLLVDSNNGRDLTTLFDIIHQCAAQYGNIIDAHLITTKPQALNATPATATQWIDRGMKLTEYHQLGKQTAYLIRPDGHIGYIHQSANWQHLCIYLHEMLLAQKTIG
ncbi:MAG: FAD-dependent monooxygenase [Chloroflexales bacterium]|nr:FAD-dependent monooxygenase [Chloroflexales bacterium]